MDFYSTTEGTTSNDEATAEQSANVASPLPPQSRPYDYPKSYDQTEPLTTPHTITVLMLLLGGVFYVFQTHEDDSDAVANVKLGLACALAVGLIFSAEHMRDTLLIRPHPAVWRLATGVGLFYAMFMTFLLFQNLPTIHTVMNHLDPIAGIPHPHKTYGDKCELTYDNIMDAVNDRFVIAHALGWFGKAMIFRDVWILHAVSFLFEMVEYSLVPWQPNFEECWWDHWILDFIVCNAGGIYLGIFVLRILEARNYDWVAITERTRSRRRAIAGSIERSVLQFTPYSWTKYQWKFFRSPKRLAYAILLVTVALVQELNSFFLKDIFLVPVASQLNVVRLLFWWAMAVIGVRDVYHFMTDASVKRISATAWVAIAALVVESLVVYKFGRYVYTQSLDPTVVMIWTGGAATVLLILVLWTIVHYINQRRAPAVAAAEPDAAEKKSQ